MSLLTLGTLTCKATSRRLLSRFSAWKGNKNRQCMKCVTITNNLPTSIAKAKNLPNIVLLNRKISRPRTMTVLIISNLLLMSWRSSKSSLRLSETIKSMNWWSSSCKKSMLLLWLTSLRGYSGIVMSSSATGSKTPRSLSSAIKTCCKTWNRSTYLSKRRLLSSSSSLLATAQPQIRRLRC